MRHCRFEYQGRPCYGRVEAINGVGHITQLMGSDSSSEPIEPIPFAKAALLAPVEPSKIVCLGRNYRAHAAEMGNEVPREPLIFFKPPSSIIPAGHPIRRPQPSELVHFEGELGVVISRYCYQLRPDEDVRPYILGYTVVNDVTARDLQKKDGQWTRGKGFDTFCPVGPLVTNEIDPWKGVRVETKVNGKVHQDGTTLDLVFPIDAIIRYISAIMTLLPGDLIATGTPEGVGPLLAGDVVEVSVEGIGTLSNPVVEDTFKG
jgi:2-keto-4-pentenoate hydratase/2-oxohepta-3-ene-1,7-dioic acid hydratase in catechol pathway